MIKDIYKVNYMKDKFEYVGLLRNAKRFNINDKIFFATNNNSIAYSRIVGIELEPDENPVYTYKVTIPKGLVESYGGATTTTLICDKIFRTVEEAKDSAMLNLDRMYGLQKAEIDRFFSTFNDEYLMKMANLT